MNNFTHLHTHTQYSRLDGAILIPDLIEHLKNNNMNACAVTDHGWCAGVVDFYKQCKKGDIKPLLGSEIYCTDDKDGLYNEDKTRDNMHLVVIAKDDIGYSRLLEAVSQAALKNMYYKPRVYKEHLRALGGHCVVLSGCLGGVIAKRLVWETNEAGEAIACSDDKGIIEREVNFYIDVFGDDFYLELQVWDDRTNFQQTYNQWLLNFGRNKGLQFIITADCHYLKKEDYKLHELLMAMQIKATLEEYRAKPDLVFGPHFYVAGPEEMLQRARSIDCEEAYNNTQVITDKCNVEIELGKYKEPLFNIKDTEDYDEFKTWKEEHGYV